MSNVRFTVLFLGFLLSLPGALSAAVGDLRAAGKLVSDVATGQPPLMVNSTTAVPNLNADLLDGMHASDFALQSDGYVSFPLWALVLRGNALSDENADIYGIKLTPTGNSGFGSSVVIPPDHALGTDVLFDILVRNPSSSTCQAIIRANYSYGYRPGVGQIYPSFGFFSGAFPVLPGDSTISHRFKLTGVQAGDAVLFGLFREGESISDNCSDVRLVGVNMHYQKQ